MDYFVNILAVGFQATQYVQQTLVRVHIMKTPHCSSSISKWIFIIHLLMFTVLQHSFAKSIISFHVNQSA